MRMYGDDRRKHIKFGHVSVFHTHTYSFFILEWCYTARSAKCVGSMCQRFFIFTFSDDPLSHLLGQIPPTPDH